MERYVTRSVTEGSTCRYIHFLICHDAHWMLVVYDTDNGSWKHFNPMRQRSVRTDMHYNEALMLKERVSNMMKKSLRAFGIDEVGNEVNFSQPLETVAQCPQQKADT
ncbi:hypothetical protein CsSME_00012904 [Camellia sinensis var. sinensis]